MKLRFMVLYLALVLSANIASADMSALEAMREGDMKKLSFHSEARATSEKTYIREDGSDGQLSDYAGKHVLLNFWATWCGPCRKEMPMLSDLQRELGGEDFEVVTIATGRNSPMGMKKFFEEYGVDNLPLHRDPQAELGREMGVFGLPVTVILTPDGQEIARMQGEADWSTENAKAILRALIEGQGQG